MEIYRSDFRRSVEIINEYVGRQYSFGEFCSLTIYKCSFSQVLRKHKYSKVSDKQLSLTSVIEMILATGIQICLLANSDRYGNNLEFEARSHIDIDGMDLSSYKEVGLLNIQENPIKLLGKIFKPLEYKTGLENPDAYNRAIKQVESSHNRAKHILSNIKSKAKFKVFLNDDKADTKLLLNIPGDFLSDLCISTLNTVSTVGFSYRFFLRKEFLEGRIIVASFIAYVSTKLKVDPSYKIVEGIYGSLLHNDNSRRHLLTSSEIPSTMNDHLVSLNLNLIVFNTRVQSHPKNENESDRLSDGESTDSFNNEVPANATLERTDVISRDSIFDEEESNQRQTAGFMEVNSLPGGDDFWGDLLNENDDSTPKLPKLVVA